MPQSGYLLINCEICGKEFRTNRAHATTCSPACRQKKYRKSKKKQTVGQGGIQVESVTLSYLDWLVGKVLTMPIAED